MPITPPQADAPAPRRAGTPAPPSVPPPPPDAPPPEEPSSAPFLVVSTPICLILLWFISGVSRTDGLWFFLVPALPLPVGAVLYVSGRRRPLFRYYRIVLLAAMTVLGFEALLRVAPGVLRGNVANQAYNGYHDRVGGIYRRERNLGFEHKPDFSRNIYWNGHWWRHETNSAGWRGPLLDKADVVFLGDSMIYGHGVQNEDTAASQFAGLTGAAVANLGQQGTCPIQMWIRFRRLGEALRPKVVVLCWHPNDTDDAIGWYGLDECRRFAATPVGDDDEPVALPEHQPIPATNLRSLWTRRLAIPLRTAGPAGEIWHGLKNGSLKWRDPAEEEFAVKPFTPPPDYRAEPFAPEQPGAAEKDVVGWAANRHAVAKIAERCRRIGATLVVMDMGVPSAFSLAVERHAAGLGVFYSAAGRVALTRAYAGEAVYLAGDGHWSPTGHRIVAEELSRHPAVRTALGPTAQ